MKYYVTLGDRQKLLLASNPVNACILALRAWDLEISDDGVHCHIGNMFRISSKGFDVHNDDSDEHCTLASVVQLMYLANNNEPISIKPEAADEFFSNFEG